MPASITLRGVADQYTFCGPIALGRGQLDRAHRDPVGLDVVGVAVAAVLVVGDDDLGPDLTDDLEQQRGRGVDVGLPERARVVVGRPAPIIPESR